MIDLTITNMFAIIVMVTIFLMTKECVFISTDKIAKEIFVLTASSSNSEEDPAASGSASG